MSTKKAGCRTDAEQPTMKQGTCTYYHRCAGASINRERARRRLRHELRRYAILGAAAVVGALGALGGIYALGYLMGSVLKAMSLGLSLVLLAAAIVAVWIWGQVGE